MRWLLAIGIGCVAFAAQALPQSHGSDRQALNEIDTNEYVATLHKLAGQKWDILKKERPVARQHKCRQYLLQKGYESSIVNEALKIISNL